MRYNIAVLLALIGVCVAGPAHAITQCTVTISQVWAGEGGVWLQYTNGGAASMNNSDPDTINITAFAMTALVNQRTMTVRYTADGVNCTTFRTDLVGAYLN